MDKDGRVVGCALIKHSVILVFCVCVWVCVIITSVSRECEIGVLNNVAGHLNAATKATTLNTFQPQCQKPPTMNLYTNTEMVNKVIQIIEWIVF